MTQALSFSVDEDDDIPFTLDERFTYQMKEGLHAVCAQIVHNELTGKTRLMSPRSLAQALDTSLSMVHRLRRAGLPTYWLGQETPRFRFDEVIQWLDERDGIGLG